ncbi:MAG: glycosyltransferase [Bacteroidia bacterium]|nr:glycosyltransferase [Bacteroidia bacterium]
MNQPKVSIITIVYNGEKYLEKTILSVINQTYPAIEYIIIDGGSTDKTPSIINQYRSEIQIVVSEPDKGIYDAMNKGLQNATGDFVWFMNAGDTIYEPETLTKAIQQWRGEDALYGTAAIVDETGNFLGMRRLQVPEALTWKSMQTGMVVCHQALIIRRSIAAFYDLSHPYSADIDWAIRSLQKAQSTLNTHLPLCRYLEGGFSAKNRIESLLDRWKIMTKHYGLATTTLNHFIILYNLIYYRLKSLFVKPS